MKKRAMAFILCLCIVVTMFIPVAPVKALEDSAYIEFNEEIADYIYISDVEKKVVSAVFEGEALSYQWQILADSENGIWANIYDKTAPECEVSYALVKNILELSGTASIRCKITHAEGEVFTNVLSVLIREEESAPSPETEDEMVLVSDMQVLEPEEEQRTEENTEEEPAEEEPAEEEFEEPTKEEEVFFIESISEESKKLLADGDDEKDLVTITIKHLDYKTFIDNGEEKAVLGPYIATIQRGTDFHQQIITPTFLGYAPFYNGDGIDQNEDSDIFDDDATVLELNYKDIQEDIVIKVFYKASLVDYAIKYFFQNTNDDLYTEDPSRYFEGKAETGTIISDDEIREKAGDTEGFSKIYHIPEAVAADGSTVFECYYDRNYYLIKFELDGGYGVDPLYARYGTQFVVNNPVKPGYVFGGWDLNVDGNYDGVKDDLPNKVPANDLAYKAIWTEANTTYTVSAWIKDGTGNIIDYIGSYKENATSGSTVNIDESKINLSDFVYCGGEHTTHVSSCYFSETDQIEFKEADKDVLIEGDGSSVINVYFQYKEYTLRFYYAMSSGTGNNIKYYVIGGSTYRFGASATINDNDKGNEVALIDHYMSSYSSQRGQVDELPKLNEEGQKRNYETGIEQSTVNGNQYTYYYIEFKARYNDDISSLWPCSVFESVTRIGKDNTNGWKGNEAFVSAWNGEHHVYYSQHNANQTIKGKYEKLDYQLLWDSGEYCKPSSHNYGSSDTVAYLCFWENGANISWSVPKLFRYNIYVEALDGQNLTGLETKTYKEKTYYLEDQYDTVDDSDVNGQTAVALEGLKSIGRESEKITDFDTSLYKEANNVFFYYDRETNTVTYVNNGEDAKENGTVYATKNVQYGEQIYLFEPDYPSNLEPNAYYFDGWYTTKDCLENSKVNDGYLMPAKSIVLYAKWSPTVHTVRFFNSYDDLKAYEETGSTEGLDQIIDNIPHGIVVPEEVKEPTRNDENGNALTFGGWFFMENGVKRRFTPLEYPIKRDMNIFADWSTHSPQPYRISYVLKEDPTVKVADDSVGYAYAGSTRTFTAKAGAPSNQLYDFSGQTIDEEPGINYNIGYFPTVASHSITIAHEKDDKNAVINVHTFEYVKAVNISYTIQYINKETGTIIEEETKVTDNAVVTERFKVFSDMIPDAFYKRLVISVEQDENGNWVGTEENIIKFYYTPDKKNAYYAVRFMKEKLGATPEQLQNFAIDGSGGYELTETHIEGIGEVGKTVSIDPTEFEFDGFTIIGNNAIEVRESTETVKTLEDGKYKIEITAEGTELYIFYSRNEYEYNVYYYIYNTENPVPCNDYQSGYYPNEKGNAKYGSNLTRTAPDIDGYTCVSQNKTQTLLIRDNVNQNVLIFYYSPTQYTVEYVAVPSEGGWLSKTIEVVTGDSDFEGSVPTENSGYRFDGWFKNEDCTVPVANTDVGTIEPETNKLTPNKKYLSETERNIFYAKFTLLAADFTIERQNAADDDQVFVYEVKNKKTSAVVTVTITGNGSVTIKDLPLGTYTVTQKNGWSWRYSETIEIEHSQPEGTSITFNVPEKNIYWLNGSSEKIVNKRKGGGD